MNSHRRRELVESAKETEQAMEVIAKETVEADKVKAVVEVDEKGE